MEPKPDLRSLSRKLKALSNPKRLEIYLEIAKKSAAEFHEGCECRVCDILTSMKMRAPTLSQHLKELVNAGLITTERRGKYLAARVNKEAMEAVQRFLSLGKQEER